MEDAELVIKIEPLWKLLIKVKKSNIYIVKCLRTGVEEVFYSKPDNLIEYKIYKNDIPNDYHATFQSYADFMAGLESKGITISDSELVEELTKYMKKQNRVLTKHFRSK